tara:strand:- start:2852 stop:3565 length:714 start_codon:yes stop_codon:yes gene_type:complete
MAKAIEKTGVNFCYCTLAIGQKYVQLVDVFARTYIQTITRPLIVVTDNPAGIVKHDKIIPVHHKNNVSGKPISYKWLSFHHSLKLGYDNICFVDADSIVSTEYNENSILQNVRAEGLGCNWYLKYGDAFEPKRKGSHKLKKLVREDEKYPIICPVECFMFLTGEREKSVKFVNEWQAIQQKIAVDGLYHREVCHEIGLAASRSGVKVYKYPDGRRTYLQNFNHSGTHGWKKRMLLDA